MSKQTIERDPNIDYEVLEVIYARASMNTEKAPREPQPEPKSSQRPSWEPQFGG